MTGALHVALTAPLYLESHTYLPLDVACCPVLKRFILVAEVFDYCPFVLDAFNSWTL